MFEPSEEWALDLVVRVLSRSGSGKQTLRCADGSLWCQATSAFQHLPQTSCLISSRQIQHGEEEDPAQEALNPRSP